MGTKKWLAFGFFPPHVKTLVHFLPLAQLVKVPFPAVCRFTLFGGQTEKQSVFLEGASVTQPDGVWVDEVFGKVIPSSTEPVGLHIELISSQKILDLSSSACIIEFVSQSGSVKFRPQALYGRGRNSEKLLISESYPVFQDSYNRSSLVVVNSSAKECPLVCKGAEEIIEYLLKNVDPVIPPESVAEIELPIPKNLMREKGGGYIHVNRESFSNEVAHYIMYRETRFDSPISVCAL
jgi:hypothetical protein